MSSENKIKLSADEIEKTIIELRKIYTHKLRFDESKFEKFKEAYPHLYDLALSDNYDYRQFKYLIANLRKIEQNELNQYDASVKVGTMLVDKYVKPKFES